MGACLLQFLFPFFLQLLPLLNGQNRRLLQHRIELIFGDRHGPLSNRFQLRFLHLSTQGRCTAKEDRTRILPGLLKSVLSTKLFGDLTLYLIEAVFAWQQT